ncbi:SAM-dependent methyltransferase [Pseudomonas alcaligenes]|nr:SAM-dependent methyltransferase [Pseudomonas alcaligenes]
MMLWNDGYLADFPYPHQVHPELSPTWLAAVLTALGQRAPEPGAGFSYCELGCGQGLNSLLLAAANPAGRFLAVDFNARHIDHGQRLALAAGLDNLVFRQAGFVELADEEGGEAFDFIALHGVFSWVSPASRAAILRFVERRLKPGGVLYLAYMSHPGLSAFVSAQRFIWQAAQRAEGDPVQRLRIALDALQRWQVAGAGYFIEHPDVARRLASGRGQDLAFLAHELLCEHWAPLHSAEVIKSLAAVGCTFVGSATPLENIDELAVPGHCLPLLAELDDVAQRESARDMACNQSLRRDLYVRTPRALSADEHRQALLDGCWAGMPDAPDQGALRFDTRIGPVEGEATLFSPLLQALAEGPQRFTELASRPALASQLSGLNRALQMLAWAGHAHPMLTGAVAAERCQGLNRLLAEGALLGEGYGHLAAPSLGAPVAASPLEMACARVLLEHPQLRGSLLRETALALLRRHGWQVEDAAGHWQRFEARTLPAWLQLGVVAGDAPPPENQR